MTQPDADDSSCLVNALFVFLIQGGLKFMISCDAIGLALGVKNVVRYVLGA